MEQNCEPKPGRRAHQGKHDAGAASHCRTRSDCPEHGSQPIGIGEPDRQGHHSATPDANQPGSKTDGKSLRLLIEFVRNQKAIVKLQMQQLDEQERQLEKALSEYEDTLRGVAE